MLEIEYNGGNSVSITTKEKKLIVDPNLEIVGSKSKKAKYDVQIATEQRFMQEINDDAVSLQGPGEYETGPFAIVGEAARRHIDQPDQPKLSTIYRIDVLEYRLAIIGNIDPVLTEDQLEAIGTIDILVVPVGGGGYTLDAKSAAAIVRQVEPKIVVPVHYADSGLNYEVPQDTLEMFVSELGAPVEKVSKLKLKTVSMVPAALTVYQLERQ